MSIRAPGYALCQTSDCLPAIADQVAQHEPTLIELAPGAHSWTGLGRALILRPGVTISGAPNGASVIVLRGDQGHRILTDGSGAYAGLRDVTIAYDPAPSGGSVAITNEYLSRFQLRDVHIKSAAIGVLLGQSSGYPDIDGLTIESSSDGILIQAFGGPSIGGGSIRRYRAQGVTGAGSAAVRFCGPIGWDKIDIDIDLSEQHDHGIVVGPGVTGNISYLTLRGCIDGTAQMGLRLDPNGGHLRKWKLLGVSNQGHPNPGHSFGLYCVPTNGSRVDIMDVIGCTWADHDREAILLAGPASAYSGVSIVGGGADNCGSILAPGAPRIMTPAGADVRLIGVRS